MRWGESLVAYEENIELLELARKQYEAAFLNALEGLRGALEIRLAEITMPPDVGMSICLCDRDHAVQCLISVAGADLLDIQAWIASAYGGPAATLRVTAWWIGEELPGLPAVCYQAAGWEIPVPDPVDAGSREGFGAADPLLFVASVDLRHETWLESGTEAMTRAVSGCVAMAVALQRVASTGGG